MALPRYQDGAHTAYSTLEVADQQQPHQHSGYEGLQSNHLFRDETLNGKEVSRVVSGEGIEVVQKETPDQAPSETEIVLDTRWRKRRICGIPILVVMALVLLLVTGAVVGGVVGGTVGKKKDTAVATPTSVTTEAPTSSSGPTTVVVTATADSPTQTSTPNGPLENAWYKLLQYNETDTRALYASTREEISALSDETVADESIYWQFTRAYDTDPSKKLDVDGNALYWITNRWYESRRAAGAEIEPLSAIAANSREVRLAANGKSRLSMWYLKDVPTYAGENMTSTSWFIWNQEAKWLLGREGDSASLFTGIGANNEWELIPA